MMIRGMQGKILLLAMALVSLAAGAYLSTVRHAPPGEADPETGASQGIIATLPQFTLSDLAGNPRAISEWSGRALLINFWATWCAPCRREMPMLQALHEARSPDEFQVIGVAIDYAAPVEAFITESGITYPILVGEQDAMEVAEAFGAAFVGLPFTVFTAPSGAVLKVHIGEIHPEDLQAILRVTDQVAGGELSAAQGRARLQAI
jgi:thiol-disulfide isomerase/thioredoxin